MSKMVIIGDTNCDIKDNGNVNTKRLKQAYSEFQMKQLIKKYIKVATNTSVIGIKK